MGHILIGSDIGKSVFHQNHKNFPVGSVHLVYEDTKTEKKYHAYGLRNFPLIVTILPNLRSGNVGVKKITILHLQ